MDEEFFDLAPFAIRFRLLHANIPPYWIRQPHSLRFLRANLTRSRNPTSGELFESEFPGLLAFTFSSNVSICFVNVSR